MSEGRGNLPVPVDFLLLFTDGTIDTLLTATNLQNGTISSDVGTWTLNAAGGNPHTHTFLRADPVVFPITYLCNGKTIDSTANALEFLLTGVPPWEGFLWNSAAGPYENVTLQFFAKFATSDGTGDTAIDMFVLNSGSGQFSVPQNHRSLSSESGTQGRILAHANRGFDTLNTALVPNTICLVTCRYNKTESITEIVLQDGVTMALIGSACVLSGKDGGFTNMQLQDYLIFFGGFIRLYSAALDWTNAALPLGPLTIPACTSLSVSQTAVSQVTFTYLSKAFFHTIDRSNDSGVTWLNLATRLNALTYVDPTVSDKTTYVYRVTGVIGKAIGASATSSPITVSNASSLLTGLQVYYKLEDLTESIGTGLTLTSNGSPANGAGKIGNAYTFVSASSQWLNHADNTAYDMGTGSFTFSAWINFTDSANLTKAFIEYGNIGAGGWGVCKFGTHIFGSCLNGLNVDSSIQPINDGAWHLAIITVSRTSNTVITIYVDNSSGDSASNSDTTTSSNSSFGLSLGGRSDGGAHLLDGSVDEVGLWNRVITAAERSALWNGGSGKTYPF